MTHSFEAYIDESGCEGFKFRPRPHPGSPEWFILAAILWRTDERKLVLDRMRAAIDTIAPQRAHMHFTDLSHDQKVAWLDSIVKSGALTTAVLVNKPKLARPEIFHRKDRLYFYATRFLLERISWMCRDNHRAQPASDGTVNIHFSKRKNMSYDELFSYLDLLRWQGARDEWMGFLLGDIRIHWPAIRTTQIEVRPHMDLIGLQMADAVCGVLRAAAEYSNYNFTEHRFAKMLKPIVYYRPTRIGLGRNYYSYGLKFFPDPPRDEANRRPRYHWLRKYYDG